MNLNPLKKDNNTDALVKALEDAGSTDAGTQTDAVQQPATTDITVPSVDPISTPDPITSDTPAVGTDTPTADGTQDPAAPVLTIDDTPAVDPVATPADSSSGLTFEGNDLPSGLSADAEAHTDTSADGQSSDIDNVKRSALEQLRPLIEKLDLEPSDKFDKYLMMLRASDDPALIKPAFEAAQGISGEKERAQALLDIINEINYITANQQPAS